MLCVRELDVTAQSRVRGLIPNIQLGPGKNPKYGISAGSTLDTGIKPPPDAASNQGGTAHKRP